MDKSDQMIDYVNLSNQRLTPFIFFNIFIFMSFVYFYTANHNDNKIILYKETPNSKNGIEVSFCLEIKFLDRKLNLTKRN